MRKTDTKLHEAKRRDILTAAGACFLRDGFRGASVADICREAGISAGHLYHYFDSKEAIIEALAASALAEANSAFFEFLSRGLASGEFFQPEQLPQPAHNKAQALLLEILVEAGRSEAMGKIVEAHSRRVREVISDALRLAQDRGELATSDSAALVANIVMLVFDGLRGIAIRDPDFDRASAARLLNGVLGRVLAARDAG